MSTYFKCEKCNNDNKDLLGVLNGKVYCRKCISYNGKKVNYMSKQPRDVTLKLDYKLTHDQENISNKLVRNFIYKKNTLVHAVCGAGKTEIVYEVILYCLGKGGQVGFATPRKDVVIELYPRIKDAFPNIDIVCVYGEHTSKLEGDIIILTTHQLYRYSNFFDLLIVDEVDAFPFHGDDMLNVFFEKSIKGNYIWMSATPQVDVINKFSMGNNEVISLYKRFHMQDIPVPQICVGVGIVKIFMLIKKLHFYKLNKKPVMIFVPTIDECESLFSIIKLFISGGARVHSKCKNRIEIISNFKQFNYTYLVTTAVLERGVTIKDVQVIVYKANHKLYTKESLIQISGRVGRKIGATKGDVIFLSSKVTHYMKEAVHEIEFANKTNK